MKFNKKGGAAGVGFIIILMVLLVISLYLLYLNWPGDPVEYTFVDEIEDEDVPVNYGSSKQFYENMRFRDNNIGYRIEYACGTEKAEEIRRAFSILESKTVLNFNLDPLIPEITIFCSEIEPEPDKEGYFVAGEGGPTEVINTSLYGVILSGKVSFFREEKCDEPQVAIHEVLHVLGFDHNNNPNSILFPTLDCDQTIDDSIIGDINTLYSVKSAPDLKVSEIDASKSGRYLNFKISIVNQGLKDVKSTDLRVYSNGKLVKEFELGDVDIGVTKFLEVTNLNLGFFSRSKEVLFVVDEDNKIEEIFENNNEIGLILEAD